MDVSKSLNFMAASVLAAGLAHGIDIGTAPATSARRSHRPTGKALAEKRLAEKREANKAIPHPTSEPTRPVKRSMERAAAKASLSQRKRIAAQTSTKGGSATTTHARAGISA